MTNQIKFKKVGFLILLLFCNITTYAQNVISGKVISTQQNVLDNINIQLIYGDSLFLKGTTTSAKGEFSIETDKQEKLSLYFSAIGYKPQKVSLQGNINKSINIGTIVLDSADIMLNEVTVKAKRYVRKPDKVMIFPDSKQIKYATNGYDLLYNLMIPGVEIDRLKKKVSALAGEVSLYINGNKATYQEIQALRSKDIARIEYHDSPQGRFAKDIVAIDYITKKYEYGGYILSSAHQRIGYLLGDYMVTAQYNKKYTTYSIIVGCEIEKNKINTFKNEFINLSQLQLDKYSYLHSSIPTNTQYIMLSMDKWIKNDNLKLMTGYVRNDIPNQVSNNSIKYKELQKVAHSYNHEEQMSNKPYIGMSYYHPINEEQWLMAEVSAAYTKNLYERNYKEDNPLTNDQFTYNMKTDENYYRLVGDIIYYINLKNNNYFMANLTHYQYITSDTYTGDIQSDMNLLSGESQFRLTYAQTLWKKLFLQFTLGGSINMYSLKHEMSKTTFSPRPYLQLQYTINNKNNISAFANMGNSHPQLSSLNNLDQPVDFVHTRRGNPNLGITKFIGSNITYTFLSNKFNLSAGINYNAMLNLQKNIYYEENNTLIQSFLSDGNYHYIQCQLSPSFSFLNNSLRIKTDLDFNRSIVTGKNAMSKNNLSISANASYSFKNFFIQAYYNSPVSMVTQLPCQYKTPSNYGLSISYFIKKWSMEIGTSNPFSQSPKVELWLPSDIYSYTLQKTENPIRSMAYIKLSYSFDFGKKIKKNSIKVDKQIDSAIFK